MPYVFAKVADGSFLDIFVAYHFFFFLTPYTDRNAVSKSRKIQNNQPSSELLLFAYIVALLRYLCSVWGWSGGAMVLGKLPVPGRPTNLD